MNIWTIFLPRISSNCVLVFCSIMPPKFCPYPLGASVLPENRLPSHQVQGPLRLNRIATVQVEYDDGKNGLCLIVDWSSLLVWPALLDLRRLRLGAASALVSSLDFLYPGFLAYSMPRRDALGLRVYTLLWCDCCDCVHATSNVLMFLYFPSADASQVTRILVPASLAP